MKSRIWFMSHLHRNLSYSSNFLFHLVIQLNDYALFCLLNGKIEMNILEFSQHTHSSDIINKYLLIQLSHWPILKCSRTSKFPISDGTRPAKLLPPVAVFIKILWEIWCYHREYIIINSWWLDTHLDPILIPLSLIRSLLECHHLACY